MISSLWNNLAENDPLIVTSGLTSGLHRAINMRSVLNRGDLAGIILETLTKVAAPGSGKKITVFYAFSMYENRVPDELLPASASQDCALDTGGVGTRRTYSLPINYGGGNWFHFWFTADSFTTPTCVVELDLTVLAKTVT